VVRRIVMSLMSFGVVLGLGIVQLHPSFGQDTKKETAPAKSEAGAKDVAPKPEAQKTTEPGKDTKPAEPAKDKKDEKAKEKEAAPQATEAPLPPIPKEVQEKLEAARRAVAEAIVAAQDAGLVETSVDPPPVLDILITGRATDARTLKNASAKKPYAVSPEVFAAWFTSYAAPGFESVDYVKDVRIMPPSAGLKSLFDQRAALMRNAIAEVRKAKGQPATTPAKAAEKKEEKKEEKKDDTKKAAEVKK
jgi:hypothetical protein